MMSPIDFELFSLRKFETNPQIIAIMDARSGTNCKMSSKIKLTIAPKTLDCPLANSPLITFPILLAKELLPKISVSELLRPATIFSISPKSKLLS